MTTKITIRILSRKCAGCGKESHGKIHCSDQCAFANKLNGFKISRCGWNGCKNPIVAKGDTIVSCSTCSKKSANFKCDQFKTCACGARCVDPSYCRDFNFSDGVVYCNENCGTLVDAFL